MADETISVRRRSRPKETLVLLDRRNRSNPSSVVNITGYSFRLTAKQQATDTDAEALFNISGTIDNAAKGIYSFQLGAAETSFPPATYPAEIRWWDDADETKIPTDSLTVDYIINAAIDSEV